MKIINVFVSQLKPEYNTSHKAYGKYGYVASIYKSEIARANRLDNIWSNYDLQSKEEAVDHAVAELKARLSIKPTEQVQVITN